MMRLSIDPGLRGCGVALWTHSEHLAAAAYVAGGYEGASLDLAASSTVRAVADWVAGRVSQIIVETPQTYAGRSAKGDTNDLIGVSMVVGGLLMELRSPARLVRPAEWKGQVPKKTKHKTNPMELRCRAKLGTFELANIKLPGKKLEHNVWDAVGIGMWYFDR